MTSLAKRACCVGAWLAATALLLLQTQALRAEPLSPSYLLIGDSHTVGTFGEALDTLLRSDRRATVRTIGSCGMSPRAFNEGTATSCGLRIYDSQWTETLKTSAPTPLLATLLAESPPAWVVVALGANQIMTASSQPEIQRAQIRKLLDQIEGAHARCLWVGPPAGPKKPPQKLIRLYELLKAETDGRCLFLDSRPEHLPFLDYSAISAQTGVAGDGAHYDGLGAAGRTALRRWAGAAFELIQRTNEGL